MKPRHPTVPFGGFLSKATRCLRLPGARLCLEAPGAGASLSYKQALPPNYLMRGVRFREASVPFCRVATVEPIRFGRGRNPSFPGRRFDLRVLTPGLVALLRFASGARDSELPEVALHCLAAVRSAAEAWGFCVEEPFLQAGGFGALGLRAGGFWVGLKHGNRSKSSPRGWQRFPVVSF